MTTSFEPTRVTPDIFQGGYVDRPEMIALQSLGVTHVLNLDFPYDNTRVDLGGLDIRITEILLQDMSPMPQSDARRVVAAMYRAIDIDGGHIYVHCNAGLSRSPTTVWLYMICSGWDGEAASEAISRAASHLSAPEPVLVHELDLARLRTWAREPRWELWRQHPLREGRELVGTYETRNEGELERDRQIARYEQAAVRAGKPHPSEWHWLHHVDPHMQPRTPPP